LAIVGTGASTQADKVEEVVGALEAAAPALESAAPTLEAIPGAVRLSAAEQATAARLIEKLGIVLRESAHVGAEYVDALGRTYDALGTPAASRFWNAAQFMNSIASHLLKSNDFTVIDLTGFTQAQIGQVNAYLATLTAAQLARIIRVGF